MHDVRKREHATDTGAVHRPINHESSKKHVTGEARYIDDLSEPPGMLHVQLGQSSRAHAKILSMDLECVRASSGVVATFDVSDIPGVNDVSAVAGDDPLFADGEALYAGQCLFAVAADDYDAARRAARLAVVKYEDLPAQIDIASARQAGSAWEAPQVMARGDVHTAIRQAARRLCGRLEIGGQDHFYLEGQIAMALPGEDGDLLIYSSTQNPTEVQHVVARVLGLPDNAVTVDVRRLGGGFGGKETQASLLAAAAALVATRTGRAAKCRFDRDDDMKMTGKRHDFEVEYNVGSAKFRRLCRRSAGSQVAI